MEKKKKILVSVFDIENTGGVSTSMMNFLNTFAEIYDITLCVLTNSISEIYEIPTGIKVDRMPPYFYYIFGNKRTFGSLSAPQRMVAWSLRLVRILLGYERMIHRVIKSFPKYENYDVAIAFSNDIYSADGTLKRGGDYEFIRQRVKAKTKLAWIHNEAKQLGFTQDICSRIFKDFDAIVNVSYDCKRDFDKMIPQYEHKSYVVYNCYSIDEIKTKMNDENPFENNGKLHFVTVCRMNEQQKRVSRIVEVCKWLKCEEYNNFDWTVVGDGGDRANYEAISQTNGTTDILHFVGLKANPYPYMKHADAFILSSLYEGFGMVIREAQITGTPTFSTRFGAAEEAIEVGKQGEICENSTEGLYKMVKSLLDTPDKLQTYRDYLADNPISNDQSIKQFNNIIHKL